VEAKHRRVDDWLLSEIAKDLHLSKRELLTFIECRIDGEAYATMMRNRGHIHA